MDFEYSHYLMESHCVFIWTFLRFLCYNPFVMELPIEFVKRMKTILGDDYPAFEASFSETAQKGIHLNPGRCSEERLLSCMGSELTPIPHVTHGYYYNASNQERKIGMHPLHHGGAVYSQDPSAMLPVSGIEISPDWRVLDLCAAPGGKSSQIASKLSAGAGFLVSNEINPSRNKILISNMVRMGYPNVIVTKLTPDEIADCYPGYFHMVLVDAPCSGEGMFRKYPESISEWSLENVIHCQARQKEILNAALRTLLPGGYLVYSTCTYSVEENEDIVRWLMKEHHMMPVDIPEKIRSVTAPSFDEKLSCCRRAYPHITRGEGQFMAYLKKSGELPETQNVATPKSMSGLRKISDKNKALVWDALKENFDLSGFCFYEHQNKMIAIPAKAGFRLPNHGITLCGITVGMIEHNRFLPHHHFFHSCGNICNNILSLDKEDQRILQYLTGQEIYDDRVKKGYGVVCFEGCPIGGFKASGGRLKNHYPKALRNLS